MGTRMYSPDPSERQRSPRGSHRVDERHVVDLIDKRRRCLGGSSRELVELVVGSCQTRWQMNVSDSFAAWRKTDWQGAFMW